MSKIVITLDQRSSIALPAEALNALVLRLAQNWSSTLLDIVGRALVVRSLEEARRSRIS